MPKRNDDGDVQHAALPYRLTADGALEVLLLTSRDTRRWVVPKGWPMRGKKPHRVAEIEAFQEAGITGRIARRPIGLYPYTKEMADGGARLLFVDVYPLLVRTELAAWPEARERTRSWFSPALAASLVDEGELALIIERLGGDPGAPVGVPRAGRHRRRSSAP